jgi:hypothetical protein
MKLYSSFLSIGILLGCIYFSLDEQKISHVSNPSSQPALAANKNDNQVKLFNFHGDLNGNKIELQWMVNNNEAVNQFEIERSADGKIFKTAALVFGTDKANTDSYMFYEKAATKKISYRIKIIDNNGATSYSDIIEVGPEYPTDNNVAFQNK